MHDFQQNEKFQYVGGARPFKEHSIAFYLNSGEGRLYYVTSEHRASGNVIGEGYVPLSGSIDDTKTAVVRQYMKDRPVLVEKEGRTIP